MAEYIKILFVEDVRSDAEIIWQEISAANILFRKVLVDNSKDYTDAIIDFLPDLIISDYALPQFDGMTALKIKNEMAPDLPFILVTGSVNEEVAVECMKAGANDYILKENLSRLGSSIKHVLKEKRIVLEKEAAEKSLFENEAKLRALLSAMTDVILVFNKQGICIEIAPTNPGLLYKPPEMILGKSLNDIFPVSQAKFLLDNIRKTLKGNCPVEINYSLEINGRELWFDAKLSPLSKDSVLLVARDITESKMMEIALGESEMKHRLLLEESTDPIFSFTREGVYSYVNRAFANGVGKKVEEIINKKIWDVFPEEEAKKRYAALEYVFNTGNSKVIEVRVPAKEKDKYYITTITPAKDDKGNVITVICSSKDITDRKEMEERQMESEAYYRTLVDISPDGILLTDPEGKVTYGSVMAYEIFGVPPGVDVTGSHIFNWIEPDFHKVVLDRMEDIRSGNIVPETREYKLRKFDRSTFWGEMSSSPLQDAGGTINAIMIICRDVSERKNFEEELIRSKETAEQSDRLKTAFLHNISHELRTPMNAIVGFSTLLTDSEQNESDKGAFAEIILNSSNHLLAVVNDIIEISNIEAGITMIKSSSFNLTSLIDKLIQQFDPLCSQKGIDFSVTSSVTGNQADIETDRTKLIQVLTNLIGNAVKFTPGGNIELTCDIKDNMLLFRLSDTGIGIPEEHQTRVFDRFYQVESTIARNYHGTGLGLAISKAFVELLGGEIWFGSEEGKGSVFSFTIPYKPTTALSAEPEVETANIHKAASEVKRRVLIAEDEENNYLLLVKLLTSLNIEIVHACNGQEAVEICRSDLNIKLVLMDIKMSVMDGYTATREIRKIYPDLPVIALTAYAFGSDRDRAIQSGCNDYISKPFKKELLLETISRYI